MNAALSKKRKKVLWGILILLLVLAIGAGLIAFKYYRMIFISNVDTGDKESVTLYIPSGSSFDDVTELFREKHLLRDENSFIWLCEKKGYMTSVRAGRYKLTQGMTNNTLINMLRSGRQEPLRLTLNSLRTKSQLAQKAGKLLETDSAAIMEVLNDNEKLKEQYGMNKDEIMCIFIPNTYEFYWNTSAEEFVEKMYGEYQKFWTDERKKKAEAMNLTQVKVCILASIVYQETKKIDEVPRIAGVYMNRLKKGMYLQACPTVIFAIGDFTMTRVLNKDTEVNSPYNTYKHSGLPPGPICLPPPDVVDQTLNYEKSEYLFFSAKEDFSGYHNFARTNAEHERNAAKYHEAYRKWLKKKKEKENNE